MQTQVKVNTLNDFLMMMLIRYAVLITTLSTAIRTFGYKKSFPFHMLSNSIFALVYKLIRKSAKKHIPAIVIVNVSRCVRSKGINKIEYLCINYFTI